MCFLIMLLIPVDLTYSGCVKIKQCKKSMILCSYLICPDLYSDKMKCQALFPEKMKTTAQIHHWEHVYNIAIKCCLQTLSVKLTGFYTCLAISRIFLLIPMLLLNFDRGSIVLREIH